MTQQLSVIKLNTISLIKWMRSNQIENVSVTYSGGGDSGEVEEVDIPEGKSDNRILWIESANKYILKADISQNLENIAYELTLKSVGSALEDMTFEMIDSIGHGGWENNDGGQGTFSINSEAAMATLSHGSNFTEEKTYEDLTINFSAALSSIDSEGDNDNSEASLYGDFNSQIKAIVAMCEKEDYSEVLIEFSMYGGEEIEIYQINAKNGNQKIPSGTSSDVWIQDSEFPKIMNDEGKIQSGEEFIKQFASDFYDTATENGDLECGNDENDGGGGTITISRNGLVLITSYDNERKTDETENDFDLSEYLKPIALPSVKL